MIFIMRLPLFIRPIFGGINNCLKCPSTAYLRQGNRATGNQRKGKDYPLIWTLDRQTRVTMRGIKKEQASTVTNYYLGQFKEDLSFQNRYLRFISIVKD